MSLHRANGTRVTSSTLDSLVTAIVDPDPYVTVNERLVVRTEFSGGDDATGATGDDKVATAFQAGQKVRKSQIAMVDERAKAVGLPVEQRPRIGLDPTPRRVLPAPAEEDPPGSR